MIAIRNKMISKIRTLPSRRSQNGWDNCLVNYFYRVVTTVKKFVQDSEENAIRDEWSRDGVDVKVFESL